MALSDSPRIKKAKRTRPSHIADRKKPYSDNQKLETVKLWLISGNLKATAAALNIPFPTVRQWRYSEWWKELVDDLRSEDSIKLSSKLTRIAGKALDITEDRLDNGDFVLNQKTGELIRKPVPLREAHRVAVDLTTQADTVLRKPQALEAEEQTKDILAKLANAFEEFAKKDKPKQVTVTDVVFGKELTNTDSVE